jgi:PTH1 family peptidyl-tRNA hydrolase
MIIIGLGNSGPEYRTTYHNAGFLFVDFLAAQLNLEWKDNPYIGGLIAQPPGKQYFLVKPHGYMNESGRIIAPLLKFYAHEGPLPFYIAHDDADIPLGSYKVIDDAIHGAAGHHGVESILSAAEQHTITPHRIRIGIREAAPEARGREKAGDFVLKKISAEHTEALAKVFEKIAQDLRHIADA